MATVDKNFKVKNGLIVEGTTATVNGEDIITTGSTTDSLPEGSTNLYFTNQRAIDAVGGDVSTAITTAINALSTDDIEEGTTNRYFTNQRALDATASAYDVAGAASSAQTAAENYADGVATTAYNNAVSYADGLAVNYDPAGSADAAEGAANTYADGVALTAENNAKGYADTVALTAEQSAKSYADSLATNYDPAGSAQTAETNAATYTDTAIANLVDGAPALLDTLNELAAAVNDDASFASTIATSIGEKVAKSGDTMTGELVLAADPTQALAAATKQYVDAQASDAYNDAILTAAGTAQTYANTAEQNAKDYADGLATNYDAAGTASGLVDDVTDGTTAFTAVNINSLAKQVAATSTSLGSVVVTAYEFAKASYKTAKFLVKIDNGTENEVSEILLTLDSSDNIAITEYAIVSTNGSRGTITADISGSNVRLRVNPVNDSTINVVGTLLV